MLVYVVSPISKLLLMNIISVQFTETKPSTTAVSEKGKEAAAEESEESSEEESSDEEESSSEESSSDEDDDLTPRERALARINVSSNHANNGKMFVSADLCSS